MISHAGPTDGYALSNDAALRGGAAVVLGRDAGSVWYNPASAAATHLVKFDASASAYGLQFTKVPGGMRATLPDRVDSATVHDNQFQIVPAQVSFGFGSPNRSTSALLSMHTSEYADVESRLRLQGRNVQGGYDYEQNLNLISRVRRYHFGLTLAWEPSPRVRVGATLGGVLDSKLQFVRFNALAGESTTGPAFNLVFDLDASSQVFAAQSTLGVQFELARWLHVGASIRPPSYILYTSRDGGETLAFSIRDENGVDSAQTIQQPSATDDPPQWLTPWNFLGGIPIVGKNFDAELDAEYTMPKKNVGDQWKQQSVWNVRIGGSYKLSDSLFLGAGAFTDRSKQPKSSIFPDILVHRWGGSLAVRIVTRVRLHQSERAKALMFETTLALRGAMGSGQAGYLAINYSPQGAHLSTLEQEGSTRALQKLLTAHVGTGMRF